jgi:hypothetical protein
LLGHGGTHVGTIAVEVELNGLLTVKVRYWRARSGVASVMAVKLAISSSSMIADVDCSRLPLLGGVCLMRRSELEEELGGDED